MSVLRESSSSRRRWLSQVGLVLTGSWLGAGCALRSRPALPHRTFLLAAPAASPTAPAVGGDGTLLIRLLRVAAPYDSRAFVLRRSDVEFATDPYDAFLLSPGPMLTELLAGWARSRTSFANVTTGGSLLSPTHTLEGEIEELYIDLRTPNRPQAVLALRLQLLPSKTDPATPLRWQHREQRSVPITGPHPDDWVAGWNRALAEILVAMEPGLKRAGGER